MRRLLSIGVVSVVTLASATAAANSSGVAGYTGKPNAAAPQGESCSTNCHTGGTQPTVTINGPSSLAAGQSAEYTLVVSTNAARVGAGVAATDGAVLANVTGLRDSFGELVQNAPVAPSGGQATFRFTVKAPMTGTAIKLWAVGLAANNNGGTSGDAARQTTKDITITGGTPPPPDGSSSSGGGGSSSGGSSSGSTSSSSSSGGGGDPDAGIQGGTSTSSSGSTGDDDDELGADPDDDDEGTTGTGKRSTSRKSSSNTGASSCATSPSAGTSSAFVLVGLAIAALAGRRRERERS
jgi:MYXO-CTERM domain-containing protein